MKTRMQPIGNAWAKLPRMVRDLAHELDKKIDLQHARRRDRARPPGPRADQGPAHAPRAQLAPITAWSGPKTAARRARRRPAASSSTPTTRAARSSSRSPTTAAACRSTRSRPRRSPTASPPRPSWPPCRTSRSSNSSSAPASRPPPRSRTCPAAASAWMWCAPTSRRSAARSSCARSVGKGTTFFIKIPLTLAIVSALIVEACCRALRHPADQRDRAGARDRQVRPEDRTHQGRSVPAPAQPAAAARQSQQSAEDRRGHRQEVRRRVHRRQPGRQADVRHRRRSRVRHRGNRRQAGGARSCATSRCSPATRSWATAA